MFQHQICRQLKISRRCTRQTIRHFDRYGTVPTRPDAGRPRDSNDLINMAQQTSTNSLRDLVRYAMNLSINTSTISRILGQYNILSS